MFHIKGRIEKERERAKTKSIERERKGIAENSPSCRNR